MSLNCRFGLKNLGFWVQVGLGCRFKAKRREIRCSICNIGVSLCVSDKLGLQMEQRLLALKKRLCVPFAFLPRTLYSL